MSEALEWVTRGNVTEVKFVLASVVAFLPSDEASAITGALLR